MTEAELAALEALAAKATPGPWGSEDHVFGSWIWARRGVRARNPVIAETNTRQSDEASGIDPSANAAFIAAARTAVPELIAEVRRLQNRLDDIECDYREMCEYD